jgi:methylmalonyl-CoA mutase N-terminal domain/subunit
VVGVNDFVVEEDAEIATFEHDDAAAQRQIDKLQALRASRDGAAVAASLDRLRQVCATDENVMPAVIECVKSYATTGEIAGVWREVLGNYQSQLVRLEGA